MLPEGRHKGRTAPFCQSPDRAWLCQGGGCTQKAQDDRETGEGEKALFYRIPDPANIRITDETTTLAEKEVLIHQFGPIVRLPVNFLLK